MEILYVDDLLYRNVWLTVIIWWILVMSDYYLTIYGAHVYRAGYKEHIDLQGSYELNPHFQRDVDSSQLWSPRFVRLLLSTSVSLIVLRVGIWFLQGPVDLRKLFAFFVGAMFLRTLVVILIHLRNIDLFRIVRTAGGLTGKVEWARWLSARVVANEFLIFAGLFLLIYLEVRSWLFLGGAVSALLGGVNYRSLYRKLYLEEKQGIGGSELLTPQVQKRLGELCEQGLRIKQDILDDENESHRGQWWRRIRGSVISNGWEEYVTAYLSKVSPSKAVYFKQPIPRPQSFQVPHGRTALSSEKEAIIYHINTRLERLKEIMEGKQSRGSAEIA